MFAWSLTAKLEGRSCEYNGHIYQNGEDFRAGCKHQCTCIDGAVGCVPLCATEVLLASPACPSPRLIKVPGQCCPSVDCHRGSSLLPPVYRPPQPPPYIYPYLAPYPKPFPKNFPARPKDTLSNELTDAGGKWEKPRGHKRMAGERLHACVCVISISVEHKSKYKITLKKNEISLIVSAITLIRFGAQTHDDCGSVQWGKRVHVERMNVLIKLMSSFSRPRACLKKKNCLRAPIFF